METSQQELDRTVPQDQMRCPTCGGLNRAGADWCGQCLRRFTAPPAPVSEPAAEAAPAPVEAPVMEVPGAQAPVPVAPSEVEDISAYASYIDDGGAAQMPAPVAPTQQAGPEAPQTKSPPPEAVGTERGAFKVRPEGIVWTCKSCDTENPIALQACGVCGTQFANTLRDEKTTRIERDPGTVAMFSLFMPGAGHAYMGMWGQAIARCILQIWVLFTTLMGALQKGGSSIIVMVFGMASVALWVLAAHDAYREASHQPNSVILKGRAFMYVVLGLLMVLIVLLMGAGMKAT